MYTALIAFALLSVIASFLCSLWEAVLLSVTPAYAQAKLNEGTSTGQMLESFKANIDKPLAAILTLNTFAHTIGAIGVGHQASKIWADSNPLITGFVIPFGMTVVVLILSEIIPKTLGANYWRVLAPFTTRSLSIILAVLSPIVWLCQLITSRLKRDKDKSVFSRTDFLAMAQIGAEEGHLHEQESDIIRNLLHFNKIPVKEIMTPRVVVVSADEDMTVREFYDSQQDLIFSRIPLYRDNEKDHITGYVLKDHVLEDLVEGEDGEPLKSARRDIIVVKEAHRIIELFNEFVEKREHIALVVDEFGGMLGIVTMEDIIETLLGMEIIDELDDVEDMQDLARKNWKIRAQQEKNLRNVGDENGD